MKDIYSERTSGRIPLLAEERGRQGLCTFCAAVARCALIEPSRMPVLQCEEFRTTFRSEGRIIQEGVVLDTDPGEVHPCKHVDYTDWGQKGLCGNCAICDACPLTNDEGGVWHCEDYC